MQVIIVLSDALSAFGLPSDGDRQKLLWVDGLSKSDAENYLRKKKFMVPVGAAEQSMDSAVLAEQNKWIEKVISSVGTRPADLNDSLSSCSSEETLNEFVEGKRSEAVSTLGHLLSPVRGQDLKNGPTGGPAFAQLVRLLLLTKDDSVGVSEESTEEFLAPPRHAAEVLKNDHAIVYNIVSKRYHFASPAFRYAAEEWVKKHDANNARN